MLVKRLLNRVARYKGFVYEDVKSVLLGDVERIQATTRKGNRCSVHDHGAERRFNDVPLWGIPVVFRWYSGI